MQPSRHATKWLAFVVIAPIGGYLLFQLLEYNRVHKVEGEYESLRFEYLNPDFTDEFCAYWQISNIAGYRKALKQQFDIARFEAMEQAYGESVDETLYFYHLRMINWLDLQILERVQYRLMFERRGENTVGPCSIDLQPMSDELFQKKVPY
jgi:hypothetical protein